MSVRDKQKSHTKAISALTARPKYQVSIQDCEKHKPINNRSSNHIAVHIIDPTLKMKLPYLE
jgi:hypothetical protein